MAEIELHDVSMSYGDTRVLTDLSLTVTDGSFYAMVGPSGSGKTTILKIIAGFVAPEAGRVHIAGADTTGVPPERRDLGIVFQNYALFPHMTVAQNVGFGLRMRRVDTRESRGRIAEMLDLVGLPGYADRYPDELSGGQQQRVALARALVIRPKALLLDEPLSALDRKIREEMHVELRRIQREANVTAIIVTHDQVEALALGDRLMVLDEGVVQQEGDPWDVYAQPRSRFVATFLGKANLFEATVRTTSGGAVMIGATEVAGITLPAGTEVGDALTLCVRPERWIVAAPTSEEPTEGVSVTGRVRVLRQTGQTSEAIVDSALGELSLTALSTAAHQLDEGANVRLVAPPASIHVIPPTVPGDDGSPDPASEEPSW